MHSTILIIFLILHAKRLDSQKKPSRWKKYETSNVKIIMLYFIKLYGNCCLIIELLQNTHVVII